PEQEADRGENRTRGLRQGGQVLLDAQAGSVAASPRPHHRCRIGAIHSRDRGLKSMTSMVRPERDRVDWAALKGRIDLAGVLARYLGPAPGRRWSGPLWWRCPFHDDRNPSLRVKGRSWRCYGCGAKGDAAGFVMKLLNVGFVEAIRELDGRPPAWRA